MITQNESLNADGLTEQEAEMIAAWEEQQDGINSPSAWECSQFF